MNKLFRILGIAAMIGFSFAACSNGSTGGGVIPAEWVGTYEGGGDTATLNADGSQSWAGWDMTPSSGTRAGATISEGGTLTISGQSGKWVYLYNNGNKEGIIIYSPIKSPEDWNYIMGVGEKGNDGVPKLVSQSKFNGVVFSPEPDTSGYPSNYYFIGGR